MCGEDSIFHSSGNKRGGKEEENICIRMDSSPSRRQVGECESGWTLYLDQSTYSPPEWHRDGDGDYQAEDLSMVSDASSGPPHFREEDGNAYFLSASESTGSRGGGGHEMKESKSREHKGKQHNKQLCLDDTATSPMKGLSKEKMGGSNDCQQAPIKHYTGKRHLKGSASTQRKSCFLRSSVSEKPTTPKPDGFQGNWE